MLYKKFQVNYSNNIWTRKMKVQLRYLKQHQGHIEWYANQKKSWFDFSYNLKH